MFFFIVSFSMALQSVMDGRAFFVPEVFNWMCTAQVGFAPIWAATWAGVFSVNIFYHISEP